MLHKFLPVLIVNVFLLCYSSVSYALPINYDEALHGDINENLGQTFGLDIGRNTISGVSTIGPSADMDSFRFLLPKDTVSSFNFTFNVNGGASPFDYSSIWELSKQLPEPGTCSFICPQTFQPIAAEVVKVGNPYPVEPNSSTKFSELGLLGAGLYSINQTGGVYIFPPSGVQPYEFTISYRFSIDVHSVPEPGSLVLLLFGLFGFLYSKVLRKTL